MNDAAKLKQEILEKTIEYYKAVHKPKQDRSFNEGVDKVTYAARVFDEKEMVNLVSSSLDFWLTYGEYSKMFEEKLAQFLGVRWSLLVNSGSSANLLAFMSLTSPLLYDRRVKRGDEIITVAAGFPTTVAPAIQYGAVPVFVDVELDTFNIDTDKLEAAVSAKTKAVMIAHTLGNPFNIEKVKAFCEKHKLWLIEDNCDALGSKFNGKYTGTFGDIGTSSFYPPHHMTMGEGGAVYTSNPTLRKIMLSIRDWGRDCWCDSGRDNTCGERFSKQFGKLPKGYDHKYVYSHFGYNLKVSDMQAAVGVAQLDKLPSFIEKRRKNFDMLYNGLKHLDKYLVLPKATEGSEPSWFGFLLTIKPESPATRNELAVYLEEEKNIQTRNLFGGNIVCHPCFEGLTEGLDYKISGKLKNTDIIMNDSIWLGVYPGMKQEQIDYIIKSICQKFA